MRSERYLSKFLIIYINKKFKKKKESAKWEEKILLHETDTHGRNMYVHVSLFQLFYFYLY